ncbi:MAG: 2-hydroxyglutaryl-CoA dehydratase [Dehalococcoidales bacterium]|nr:2-hydroxyglutaryl-CoA dehydratase [Dehalococcoidales bacterium]
MTDNGRYYAGIDLGSAMTKVVIIDSDEKVCASVINHTGAEHRRLANKVMEEAIMQAGLSFDELSFIVSTGYGRMIIPFADRQITELTCHARGVVSYFPGVRLAIDIGGQDSKGLKINNGRLIDFSMNDKCAAGTGRFLEIICGTLGLKLEELGDVSLKSTHKVSISSTCTFFAQQEVITRLSEGSPLEDIVAGIHDSIASRVARMVGRLTVRPDVVFTGGVAKNPGVVKALEANLGCKVLVPGEPLLSGALGAALLAKEISLKYISQGKPVPKTVRHLGEAKFFS